MKRSKEQSNRHDRHAQRQVHQGWDCTTGKICLSHGGNGNNGPALNTATVTEDMKACKALDQRCQELQELVEELEAYDYAVAHILEGTRRMSEIIDSLLLLASSNEKAIASPLDMAQIVAEAQRDLSTMIERCRASVSSPKRWPAARGYAPWVRSVWTNYLSNALNMGGRRRASSWAPRSRQTAWCAFGYATMDRAWPGSNKRAYSSSLTGWTARSSQVMAWVWSSYGELWNGWVARWGLKANRARAAPSGSLCRRRNPRQALPTPPGASSSCIRTCRHPRTAGHTNCSPDEQVVL